jgi:hypothetical protein
MSNVMTPIFRISYPNIFKAKKNDLNGKEEYSCVALFAKGQDLSILKKAAEQALEDKWGKDKSKRPQMLKSPFRDQAERARYDAATGKKVLPSGYEEGAFFITLKSDQRPGVVDQNVQEIVDPSQIFAGCYCRATIRAYAYDAKGNKGVAFGLQNIQFIRNGDPLSGRTRAQDDFSPVASEPGDKEESATGLFD